MKITFVRHGETDWNKAGRIMGQTDLPLNDTGLKQASEIAQELTGDFDVIFTSSRKRALDTASYIKERFAIPIVVSDLISERDFGSLEGKTWDEINAEVGFDARAVDKKQEYDYRPFGGESASQVKKRLEAFFEAVKASGYGKPLVVCHGGIIRMLHFLQKREFAHIPNASTHEFEI